MQVKAANACVSAHINKGIGKVKCSGNAKAGTVQGRESRKVADSVHTSPVAHVMSRELSRIRDHVPASPERLAALMSRFGGDSPANLADAEIDSVLHGILQRA